MTVINLDTIKQPVAKQVQFDGVIYNLIPDQDLDDLIEQMRNEVARILGNHKELVKTSDKVDKMANATSSQMIDFYNKHAESTLNASKAVTNEMQSVYIDFFNSALLDENNEECEAGKTLNDFFGDQPNMLATFYNKIVEMHEAEQSNTDKQFSELTDEALGKADQVKE